jgi:hypothetical protein
MKWMERNEGGEVVRRRIERKEGERQPPHYLSLLLLHPSHYLSPSFLWHTPHYRSPSFLLIFLTTSLLLVYLCHFVLSILFLQISSSIPVSLLPHHYQEGERGSEEED